MCAAIYGVFCLLVGGCGLRNCKHPWIYTHENQVSDDSCIIFDGHSVLFRSTTFINIH